MGSTHREVRGATYIPVLTCLSLKLTQQQRIAGIGGAAKGEIKVVGALITVSDLCAFSHIGANSKADDLY